MANYDDILNQAVATNAMLPEANADAAWVPPVTPQAEPSVFTSDYVFAPPVEQKKAALVNNSAAKMDRVANAASAKQQAMSPQQYFENAVGAATGQGADTASELELDLRSLSPLQMTQKYGAQAVNLMAGQAQAERELLQANTRGQRTGTQLWDDFNVAFGQGVGGALGGVGALAAGVVDDDLGTGAAGLLGDFNKFMESSQSSRLQARERIKEAKDSLDARDNAAEQVLDARYDGELMAGLKRVGRDVIDSLDNATDDPATLGSGIANALGSFVAAGPVAKGIKAATAGKLGMTTSIAATEAGGSYAQSADAIMDRTHEQLMEGSQSYRDLIAGGTSQEDAKQAVANQTGLFAAAVTAPAAAAAGRLVAKFEGNPLALGSGKQLAGNVLKETTEESVQSGAGQLAQNVAEQQLANSDKDLSEGVGRGIAEGGLYGMGMTTALGVPSIAKSGVMAAGRTVAKAFNDRVAGIEEANEKASPVADDTVAQAAAEAQATAPEAEVVLREAVAAAPAEQQAEANTYVDNLMSANTYTPDEAPAQFAPYLGDVSNRVGAIQRMAEIVNSAEEGSPDQLRAGFYLNDLVQNYAAAINSDPEALTALPDDHQAKQIVGQYQGLMGAITSTPKVMTAIETVMAALEKSEARSVDVTPASLATPKGQQAVQDVLATAELAPEKVDLATGEKILYQIQQGNVTVTPRQKAALDTSVALLRAVQAADQAAVASGQADPVSLNISSVDGEKGKSLTQHAKGIMSAFKAGDRDLAADRLLDLKNFSQGMNNKVAALNAHFAAGKPNDPGLNYEVFVGGEPVTSKAKVATRTNSEGGVKFAQKVAVEAKLLSDVYNGLVTAFPDLGAEHVAVTPLANELVGPAAEVVARIKSTKVVTAPVVKAKDTAPVAKPVTPSDEASAAPKAKEQVKPEPKVAEPVVEEAPVVEATPELKGTAAVFSQLKGGEANLFNRSFKLPKDQKTRTIGTETPVDVVRSALRDSASFTALLGSSPKGEFTTDIAKAYKAYLEPVEDFVSALDDNLQAFLDENNLRDRVAKGEPVETFIVGKSLNIAEEVDGTLVYNPELSQGAVLASLQWFLESPQIGGNQDGQDIANLLGMTEDTVSESIVTALTEGMSVAEAKRSLGQKIRSYWGVANEATGQIGYQEGIPEAMAAEMLRLFVQGGWLTETKVKLTEADGLPALPDGKANVKEFIRLIPAKIDPESPIHDFPSAIEQAVLVEPEEINYVGEGNLPKVAQDQLRNPGVKNTAQQLKAIENEQKTPYFVNHVMAGFYSALGRDNVVKLFGAGDLDPKVMNVNHAQSMEGVNRSTVAAFDHLQMLLGQVANTGPLDQTPIHYAFNMTRVGRLQMLGKHNPQSNKLVREAILPTYSTLDLSSETGADYKRFMLGVAQLLGVKVHKELQATGRAKAEAMLSGPLAPVVAELSTWANNVKVEDVLSPGVLNDAITDMLIDGFKQAGEALTPMALHAVMEYARYKGATDKSAFRTAMYVEADGVTNGPINAMVLLTTGMFKADWIRNIAKGGLFFNRPGETVNSHNQTDKQDLYQATTNVLDQNLNFLRKALLGDELGTRQMNSMLHLMTEFYGGDLKYSENEDGTGTLELKRGIAKNPLTITIYGSGAGGIAAKMTKLLTDAIYERMSQVAQAQAAGETDLAIAMFGPQSASVADAQARMDRFMDAYHNLTNTQAGVKKDGGLFFKSKPSKRKPAKLDPVKFTFETDQILNMQSNVKHLFVTPMRDAISTTVGQELLDTAELLRQATQAQSIVLEHAFKAEVETALNEKAKDPNWKKSDFLTRQELAGIQKKLEHLSPLVQTEGQSFYIAGSESADIEMAQFARALNDKYATPAFVAGPKDAGVSGIPFMNIGTGDGLMMQLISNMKNAITGTLKIFDGMNMPLDQMEEGAEQANEAVFQTWQGNPLAAVHSSFDKFMSDADLENLSPAAKLALTKALFGLQAKSAAPDAEIVQAMLDINARLLDSHQQIEARHRVMNRVAVSVDQMAAVGVPFQKNGDLPLVGDDPVAIAEQLNAYYAIELAAIRKDQPTNTVGSAINSLATVHESGARVLSAADLKNLPGTLTAEQSAVMTEVVNSLAAQDYNVVMGTPAEVAAYRGGELAAGAQGFTDIGAKTIYLLNPSTETLLHELVHAGTFEAVNAHYQGTSTKQVALAVGRIESLLAEFLATGQELTQTSESVNDAFNTVAGVISTYQSNGQQAEALNEFMAWTLTNPSLVRVAQRTEVSRLARARNAVVSFIKSLFNIKAEVGKDLFSNLLFNSAVIMQSQPALSERFAAGVLFQNSIYGNNERLTAINEALNTSIGRYLETPVKAGNIDEQSALMTGIQNAYRVAESFMGHGFNMNAQEASTFNTIVTALSTEAQIDPNAMAGVQQLYAHVMKNLTVDTFMVNPELNDPNDRAQAAEKFDVLSGKYLVTRDLAGRSSLLPAFLALATVNDSFRSVLEKLDLPKSAPNKAGTLDALLENTGNMLMDRLSNRMQGTKKANNVQQAIDLLNARMAKVINQRETYIDTMASMPGGALDRTNDIVVKGMEKLAAGAMSLAKRTQRNAAGRLERAAGGVAAGFAALINENSATAVAQATMATINKTQMWDSVHNLINDLVGRTESNASIYDMIKAVRSVVNRTRQQYRENLPETLASKFTRELTKNEKASLHRSMAKTDLAALGKDALKLVADPSAAIKGLEADLSKTQHWSRMQAKAKQLAVFMNTGVAGHNLLRNPESVARLLGENLKMGALPDIGKLDRLISLYALDGLNQADKDTLVTLAQEQKAGMEFTLAYLSGQRAEEQRKSLGRAKFNHYKGYAPGVGNEGVSMLVANDSEYAKLIGKSYQRLGDYAGSSLERGLNRGYYFIPVAARATFEQGIMQNVHQTAGGVEATTGFSLAQTAGRITDAADVKKLARVYSRETGPQHLLPVYSETGEIVAFERPLDPVMMEKVQGEQDLLKAIGIWRGRQVEEGFAQSFNDTLMQRLHAMYEKDLRESGDNAKQYVDILSTNDPVWRDAVKLISHETLATAASLFGNDKLMVRRDMLNDVLGYRAASVGDAWTGNSRWSSDTQKAVRNLAVSAFGNNAYKMLMTAEKTIQNVVSDAKVLIVVKSVIVPVANLMSNMYQLAARGVPVRNMTKAMPSKLAEVEAFTKSQVRLIEAEAELRAAHGDPRAERKLKTEIQATQDSQKRMSIWPLIEAGEFSGIADAGLTRNEIDLTSGRVQAYMEQAAAKLPGWGSTLGRYALVTKDTALFQGLQKAVEYGDFLAKSILFDDLMTRKGLTKAQALAQITEEFVNYDRLPGRFRGTMENLGLLWFYNFKIRSVKVAASMIRNNPVHALLASVAPAPELFGTIGLPTQDNMISKLMDGTLDYSIGPGQGLRSMGLNPWINLTQ